MPDWAWSIPAFMATVIGTGLARRYALHRQLLDQPGERRNHVVATPRGGGIAMLVVLLLVIIALALIEPGRAIALLMLGLSIALVGGVGWWDDHQPLSVRLRLAVHAIASLCLLAAGLWLQWPVWLCMLGAMVAMALANIWNFMDGIDGIAASQTAWLALVIALLSNGMWTAWAFALAGVASGFLCWNFPKARIFMGDVGSGVLGIALAWTWAAASADAPISGLSLLFPFAPFLIDAGFTLAARVLRGERWWQAHSSHSYQLLVRRIGRHAPVTLGYLLVSIIGAGLACWLRSGKAGPIFIVSAIMAWYMALAILWRLARRPAMETVDRSRE